MLSSGWSITSRSASRASSTPQALINALMGTMSKAAYRPLIFHAHLMLKQVAQMAVTNPTSRSFFCRPRDSMGNRRSITNNRPPYTKKPMAAAREMTTKKPADSVCGQPA